jgi:16S rRNA (uracil1498-N3)-methyltransferase
MTHRFFVTPDRVSENQVIFTEDQRKQLLRVLRLHPGDKVIGFDGSGREYLAEIRTLDEARAVGGILEVRTPDTEPSIRLTLMQCLPKGEKLDFILQKCTEIGVAEFVIVEAARSVPRISPDKLPGRLERWSAIVREAAEQSGRTRLPVVRGVIPFREALSGAGDYDAGVIAWEGEQTTALTSELPRLRRAERALYLVGPEGGFTEDEIAAADAEGIMPVSLGARTLRTETAAVVGAALIIYGLND